MSWDDDWETAYTCPECDFSQCVPITGEGKIFIIGSIPGRTELSQGMPYVGGAGEVLGNELAYNGLDMYACVLGNLWLHPPAKPQNRTKEHLRAIQKQNDECLSYSVKKILQKAKKSKAILLLGAPSVKYFTGMNVSDVNGLKVESDMLSAKIVMACVQSATVFHQSLGEFRFAITNFVKEVEKAKLI